MTMPGRSRPAFRAVAIVAATLGLVLGATVLPVASSAATTTALLYDYEFVGTGGIVPNSAVPGANVALTISGDWTAVPDGVQFAGNTTGDSSIAHGTPSTGDTLNAPATSSVGFGARIVYEAPATGTCFGDTPNITQIGRFTAKNAQAKISLSKCADNAPGVVLTCRFAGSLTPATVFPVLSSRSLVSGDSYVVTCQKTPDSGGKSTVTLSVTDVSAGVTPVTTTNVFKVAALGAMTSTQAVSVGNKWPLPAPADNTDQFVGTVTRVAYCTGATADVSACLVSTLPTS